MIAYIFINFIFEFDYKINNLIKFNENKLEYSNMINQSSYANIN